MTVLDLFSAAAGGWTLGLHRVGFTTIAACESVEWRRTLYAKNNPGVRIYDDVRTLTAERLAADLGTLPDIIVGSPPCQDISSANTKGKGLDGARSGLFFEAVRIIGECRPRWVALENSPELRTKGADRVLERLEAIGYSAWPLVVGAGDVGANHRRRRVWIVGCDVGQVADAACARRDGWPPVRPGREARDQHARDHLPAGADQVGDVDAASLGCASGRPRGCGADGDRGAPATLRLVSDADGEGQPDGASDGGEVVGGAVAGGAPSAPWAEWNGGLAGHLRMDDGLSAWVAKSRIEVGGPRGTAAAGLLVEAFGDAVLPQIPEAIGRAILRTEAALAALYDTSPERRAA